MEEAKRRVAEEREEERAHPFHAHWRSLVERVHDPQLGFDSLSEHEKLYFAVGLLQGDVYNGGFYGYFSNNDGSYSHYAELALITLGATATLEIFDQAKEMLFPGVPVPETVQMRREALWSDEEGTLRNPKLDELDRRYWANPDGLEERIRAFAFEHGLVP